MKHIKQPNFYTCYVASLAMCIDSTVEEIISVIGHDGSKVIDKNTDNKYLSVEMFETNSVMLAAYKMGYALTEISAYPLIYNKENLLPTNYPTTIQELLGLFPNQQRFIIITIASYKGQNIEHAIAYENGNDFYHDPMLEYESRWPPCHPIKYIIPVFKIKDTK